MASNHNDLTFLTLEHAARFSSGPFVDCFNEDKCQDLKIGGQWRLRESEFRKWIADNENLTLS